MLVFEVIFHLARLFLKNSLKRFLGQYRDHLGPSGRKLAKEFENEFPGRAQKSTMESKQSQIRQFFSEKD